TGVAPRIAHTAAEYGTQLALVAAGCGVALVPRLGRGEVPEQVRVLPLEPAPHRRVYAVWHADRAGHPAVTAAVAAVRASAATLRRPAPADGATGPPGAEG
ncbi:MAG TPA: LysR substrate-binding domain-containing protein, partial [Pilimelia sp.]|nr:LysR substrate-binding domain-containing protein [Pilimelia sp.]